jgi:hypothetical protein
MHSSDSTDLSALWQDHVIGTSGHGAELLESRLHMYPVDNAALQAYLAHVHRGLPATSNRLRIRKGTAERLKSGAKARLGGKAAHGMLRSHMAMAAAARRHGRAQMLTDDTDDLDGSMGLVHMEPLEDPTAKPENSYLIQGTSFPSHVTVEGPPTGGYQMEGGAVAPEAAPGGDMGADDVAQGAGSASEAEQGPPCYGPVRHLDSPLCVAKKAMAQALQAEKDVQAVDGEISGARRRADGLEGWETDTTTALPGRLDAAFENQAKGEREQERLLDKTDREIAVGDMKAMSRAETFALLERGHAKRIAEGIENIEHDIQEVKKMVGPPGVRGTRGSRGPQGARGPQGIRGPKGDTGPPGNPGQRGLDGSGGLSGPRGPAGHYMHLLYTNDGKLDSKERQVIKPRSIMPVDPFP